MIFRTCPSFINLFPDHFFFEKIKFLYKWSCRQETPIFVLNVVFACSSASGMHHYFTVQLYTTWRHPRLSLGLETLHTEWNSLKIDQMFLNIILGYWIGLINNIVKYWYVMIFAEPSLLRWYDIILWYFDMVWYYFEPRNHVLKRYDNFFGLFSVIETIW